MAEPSAQVPVSLIAAVYDCSNDGIVLPRVYVEQLRALLSQPTPTAEDRNAWDAAVQAKRAEQRAKGYTAQHDREHGVEHLLLWAQDYASRGRHLDAAALVEAAREVLFWQRTAKSDYDLIEDQLREAGLSTKTLPAAPPSIADMVAGTTFYAVLIGTGRFEQWMRVNSCHPVARMRDGLHAEANSLDPSTIRDVVVPT